jgi:hypothetical protein
MNDWTPKDEALSLNIAARVDGMRYLVSDLSTLSDDDLKRRYETFQGHIVRLSKLIDDMLTDDAIVKTLTKTIELIQATYIVPIESEMARRWRSE